MLRAIDCIAIVVIAILNEFQIAAYRSISDEGEKFERTARL